jgi:Mrp family chromosome partitioning ATPase
MEVLESELTDVDRARRALTWPAGYTVVAAAGVLENPQALILAVAVDGVVLLARSGRTMRTDLVRAREEIEAAGGSVVGTVLLP